MGAGGRWRVGGAKVEFRRLGGKARDIQEFGYQPVRSGRGGDISYHLNSYFLYR